MCFKKNCTLSYLLAVGIFLLFEGCKSAPKHSSNQAALASDTYYYFGVRLPSQTINNDPLCIYKILSGLNSTPESICRNPISQWRDFPFAIKLDNFFYYVDADFLGDFSPTNDRNSIFNASTICPNQNRSLDCPTIRRSQLVRALEMIGENNDDFPAARNLLEFMRELIFLDPVGAP